MEKEFEDYWNAHRKRMLLNAPRELRENTWSLLSWIHQWIGCVSFCLWR